MRGASDIEELRLQVLQGLVTSFTADPSLILQGMFAFEPAESDTIIWEEKWGSRGLAPFVPPGSPAPRTAPLGTKDRTAKAAFMKEKMHFDEEFLNNLRKAGTWAQYQTAKQTLAENMADLENRIKRRVEWMVAKMLFTGSFTYQQSGGVQLSVDYNIPTAHIVSLPASEKWGSGSNVDILGDVVEGINVISTANGGRVDTMFMNSQTLRLIANDDRFINLLMKSAYGTGNLFNADDAGRLAGINSNVVGKFLNIDRFIIHDEQYKIRSWLAAAVAAGATSVTVADAKDFAAGETLRLHDNSAETYEDVTISAVNYATNVLTVTATTGAYRAFEDHASQTSYFVPTNVVTMMASRVEGRPIASILQAPFGLDRHYGLKVDTHEEWDPEGIDIRVQDKCLPVLKQRDSLYILTVA